MSCGQRQHRYSSVKTGVVAAAVAAALAAWNVGAADFTWKGTLSNAWNVPGNWSGGSVPNAPTDNVLIDGAVSNANVNLDINALVGTLQIDAGDALDIPAGLHLDLYGNATINGNLALLSGDNYLLFEGGDRSIVGTGTLSLAAETSGVLVPANTNNRITFGNGLTVAGAGNLGFGQTRFTNLGTIRANLASPLTINPSGIADAFINQGTLEAAGTSTLQLAGVGYTNTGGSIQASGGIVEIAPSATIFGGTLGATSGGQLRTSGIASAVVTLDGVTLNGPFELRDGNRLDIRNAFTNDGVLQVNSTSAITDVQILGDVTFAGAGSVVLTHKDNARIYGDTSAGARRLTIGTGQTVKGTGTVGANQTKLTNQGMLLADQPTPLTIDPVNTVDGFFNRGTIEVREGSELTVVAGTSLIQDAPTALTRVLGTLSVADLQLQAGTLSGTGSVAGPVSNTGGTVAPGGSPGKLSISGNYTQGPDGTLVFEIDGDVQGVSYDWLSVSGIASLAGTAVLDFGYVPQPGAQFAVLTAGSRVGEFTNVVGPSGWIIQPAYDGDSLTFTVAAIPEPQTYALMAAGLALVGWAARRRRKRAGRQ